MAWDAVRIGIAGLVTFGVATAMLQFSVWLAIPSGALSYGLTTLALRVASLEDLRPVVGIVGGLLPRRG